MSELIVQWRCGPTIDKDCLYMIVMSPIQTSQSDYSIQRLLTGNRGVLLVMVKHNDSCFNILYFSLMVLGTIAQAYSRLLIIRISLDIILTWFPPAPWHWYIITLPKCWLPRVSKHLSFCLISPSKTSASLGILGITWYQKDHMICITC